MKTIYFLLFGLLLLALNQCKTQQSNGATVQERSVEETDTLSVDEIVTAYYNAFNSYDASAIKPLIHPDFQLLEDGATQVGSSNEIAPFLAFNKAIASTRQPIVKESESHYIRNVTTDLSGLVSDFLFESSIKTVERIVVDKDSRTIIRIDVSLEGQTEEDIARAGDLMRWGRLNHPELVERISYLSKDGGEAMISLIDFYKAAHP